MIDMFIELWKSEPWTLICFVVGVGVLTYLAARRRDGEP